MSEIDFLSSEDKNKKDSSDFSNIEYTSPQERQLVKEKTELKEPGFFKSLFTANKKIKTSAKPSQKELKKQAKITAPKVKSVKIKPERVVAPVLPKKIRKKKESWWKKRKKSKLTQKTDKKKIVKNVEPKQEEKIDKYTQPTETAEDVLGLDMLSHLNDKPLKLEVEKQKVAPPEIKSVKKEKKEEKKLANKKQVEPVKPLKDSNIELDVNLISEDFIDELRPSKKIKNIMIVWLIAIVVVMGLYGVLYSLSVNAINQIDKINLLIAENEREIQGYDFLKEQVAEFNTLTEKVLSLASTHVYWSKFLEELAGHTIANVALQSITGNISGNMVVSALARDFEDVSDQLRAFSASPEVFISAEVVSASAKEIIIFQATEDKDEISQEFVEFDIQLTVNSQVFHEK